MTAIRTWFERFPSPAIYRQVVLEHICGNKSGARELLENGFISAEEWAELRDHIGHEQAEELRGRERVNVRGIKSPDYSFPESIIGNAADLSVMEIMREKYPTIYKYLKSGK